MLEPGCLWEFEGTQKTRSVENKKIEVYDVRVRRPESVPKGIPTFGACLIAKKKSKKWRKQARKSKMKRHYKNFKSEYEELGLSPSKSEFKEYLEKEFEPSKNYKSELKWFDGAWSRFKPGFGKDKRGVSGVDRKIIIETGKKLSEIPKNFSVHKTLKKILEHK